MGNIVKHNDNIVFKIKKLLKILKNLSETSEYYNDIYCKIQNIWNLYQLRIIPIIDDIEKIDRLINTTGIITHVNSAIFHIEKCPKLQPRDKRRLDKIKQQIVLEKTKSRKKTPTYCNYIIQSIENNELENIIFCNKCKIEMEKKDGLLVCNKCYLMLENRCDNSFLNTYYDDFENMNNSTIDNVMKCYEDALNDIFGISKNSDVPYFMLEAIKNYIMDKKYDILRTKHYAYELRNILKAMPLVNGYEPYKYKKYTSQILKFIYPNLQIYIPTQHESKIHRTIFIEISTQYAIKFTGSYNMSYKYVIYKIYQGSLSGNPKIRQLLKFIYINSPTTYLNNDKKLKMIASNINGFKFEPTKENIYA